MFNDPFESFQEVVAQAKEEREQLDRLLTISAPRERLLVAVSGLILVALAVWLFFGNVTRSVTLDGVLVEYAGNPAGAGRTVQAMVWLEGDVARQIETGMAASVEFAREAGEELRLDGEIASLDAISVSGVPRMPDFEAPAAIHNVEISLGDDFGMAGLDSAECRITIELGDFTPVSLLGLGRS